METFIYTANLNDDELCDDLIEYHKSNPVKFEGGFGFGKIDHSFKRSTDCQLDLFPPLLARYHDSLQNVIEQYKEKYVWCDKNAAWKIIDRTNIQHYAPGEAYYGWHTERSSAHEPFISRHLVYMTYLNDVPDAGETEWFYQKVKIKPQKGLTAIWPAEWTHTHRGIPSPSQDKYIVTGWFNSVIDDSEE